MTQPQLKLKDKRRKKEKVEDRWTERDLTGEQFINLHTRQRAGELWLHGWGTGTTNGLWNVHYSLINKPGKLFGKGNLFK